MKLNTVITGVKLAALLVNCYPMLPKKHLNILVQAIIVGGIISLGRGNSPRLEVRRKEEFYPFSTSRHYPEHPDLRRTM